MDQNVVDETAVLVEQAGILRLPELQFRDGVGGDGVGELGGLGPANFDLAHVADVEQADGAPDGVVLLEDPGILDGHVPAAEVDHPGAQGAMD